MAKSIAVFGGSFNPAGVHHRAVALALAEHFDETFVVLCGPRPDKPPTNDIEPIHRAVMADMAFRGIPKVRVEMFDLENATFTRTHALEERYRLHGDVWHVVGTDLIKGGKDGASDIQAKWQGGAALWRELQFVVIVRDGYPLDDADLPPKSRVLHVGASGSSKAIRDRVYDRQSIDGLVSSDVAAYIKRYNLYRGAVPPRSAELKLADPKAFIVHDPLNPKAVALATRFSDFGVSIENANCILSIGGDGTMLHAIREHWRLRLPFVGLNAGHRGYLLNDIDDAELQDPLFLFSQLRVHQLPQLRIDYTDMQGTPYGMYAFNDALAKSSNFQAAWLKVIVDNETRIEKFVGDGVLVSTAAGSTSYATAMGASPMLVDAQAWLIVGDNVFHPKGWKAAQMSLMSEVRIESLDYRKRPIILGVDGVHCGEVPGFKARVSKIASIELAFSPHRDLAKKLADDVFPPR